MNRKKFLQQSGLIGAGLFIIPAVANPTNLFLEEPGFSLEELKEAVDKFLLITLNTKPDVETPINKGRYFFADSFETKINEEQNTIFDIADEVIEQCKNLGFDASELKSGKIPEGLTVSTGGIAVTQNGNFSGIKIQSLKNYNISITYHNCINISSKVAPGQWEKLKKVEPSSIGSGYVGNLKGAFRIWELNDITLNYDVKEIKPFIKTSSSNDIQPRFNTKYLKEYLPEKVGQLLNL